MDQLAEMRVFVRAVERGSFASAADDLDLTPSAISKLIGRLEARLGVRLLNRTTRRLALTGEGETYFHSGRQLIESVDNLEQEVAASSAHPRGLLRIHTQVSFGVRHLAPALIEFQRRYPDVRIDMSLTDRTVDVLAEQVDVAVRVGPLRDSTLMSRKITEIERVICASPDYLQQFGVPESPADLRRHRCIVFSAGRSRWPFKAANGEVKPVEIVSTFASDSLDCILQLALQGAGIARLVDFMASEPIRSGKLVPLLVDQHHPQRTPAFAVFPPGTQKTPKIRVFLDFLIERFGSDPWRVRRR